MRVMADAPVFAFAVVGHARIGAARPFCAGAAGLAVCAGLFGWVCYVHVAQSTRAREEG